MDHLIEDMALTLTLLASDEIPSSDYSLSELTDYCRSLVSKQRRQTSDLAPNSWSVAPRHDDMPSDARVDFVFKPTYIAVATLSKYVLRFPEQAKEVDGIIPALKTGLTFCTLRGLSGSGYDGPYGMFEAVDILYMGDVPRLLRENPDLCPELTDLLEKILTEHIDALASGTTATQWGVDVTTEMEGVVASLSLLKDPDFLMSIKEGRREDPRSRRRPIQW